MEITYDDEVFSDATFLYDYLNVGTYCATITTLNSNYSSASGWYYPAKYDSNLALLLLTASMASAGSAP